MKNAINRLNIVIKEREKMVYTILSGKKYQHMRLDQYYKCEEKLNGMAYVNLVKLYNKATEEIL